MSRCKFDSNFWKLYEKYLNDIVSKDTASDRLSYAKKYYQILISHNASELLTFNGEKRIHIMKSLASLSKYLGCNDSWKEIVQKYQLKWSSDDVLRSFNNIINNKRNYTNMLCWLKKTCSIIPKDYGNSLIYCTLTGLRPDESFKSLHMLHNDFENYMNKESMVLEHFRYPQTFIRRTKNAYVSIATPIILETAKNSGCFDYGSMKRIMLKYGIEMRMSYCRKIFATHLRMNNIESETIDLLQGRVPKSIFVRHYFRPELGNNTLRVAINSLYDQILEMNV